MSGKWMIGNSKSKHPGKTVFIPEAELQDAINSGKFDEPGGNTEMDVRATLPDGPQTFMQNNLPVTQPPAEKPQVEAPEQDSVEFVDPKNPSNVFMIPKEQVNAYSNEGYLPKVLFDAYQRAESGQSGLESFVRGLGNNTITGSFADDLYGAVRRPRGAFESFVGKDTPAAQSFRNERARYNIGSEIGKEENPGQYYGGATLGFGSSLAAPVAATKAGGALAGATYGLANTYGEDEGVNKDWKDYAISGGGGGIFGSLSAPAGKALNKIGDKAENYSIKKAWQASGGLPGDLNASYQNSYKDLGKELRDKRLQDGSKLFEWLTRSGDESILDAVKQGSKEFGKYQDDLIKELDQRIARGYDVRPLISKIRTNIDETSQLVGDKNKAIARKMEKDLETILQKYPSRSPSGRMLSQKTSFADALADKQAMQGSAKYANKPAAQEGSRRVARTMREELDDAIVKASSPEVGKKYISEKESGSRLAELGDILEGAVNRDVSSKSPLPFWDRLGKVATRQTLDRTPAALSRASQKFSQLVKSQGFDAASKNIIAQYGYKMGNSIIEAFKEQEQQ